MRTLFSSGQWHCKNACRRICFPHVKRVFTLWFSRWGEERDTRGGNGLTGMSARSHGVSSYETIACTPAEKHLLLRHA